MSIHKLRTKKGKEGTVQCTLVISIHRSHTGNHSRLMTERLEGTKMGTQMATFQELSSPSSLHSVLHHATLPQQSSLPSTPHTRQHVSQIQVLPACLKPIPFHPDTGCIMHHAAQSTCSFSSYTHILPSFIHSFHACSASHFLRSMMELATDWPMRPQVEPTARYCTPCLEERMHARTHARSRAHTHTHTRTRTHTHIHTRARARARTRAHTHTHTQAHTRKRTPRKYKGSR